MCCVLDGRIQERLDDAKRKHLYRVIQPVQECWANLATNDYLSLSKDIEVIRAAQEAVALYGTTSSGSPVVASYLPIHFEFEQMVCEWIGMPYGLLWPSGCVANESVMGVLPCKDDLVLADEYMHYSAFKGVLSSGARLVRFKHNDLDELENKLKLNAHHKRQVFVVMESLYSMDGDCPDLRKVAQLKKKYGFFWVLDEAHAVGWYGPSGNGLAVACGVVESVDVLMFTLGKALVSQGAVSLFNNEKLRDYFINNAKGLMYSTSLAPALIGAAMGAVKVIRERLCGKQSEWFAMSRVFRSCLNEFIEVPQGDSPIVPVIIRDEEKMLDVMGRLKQDGVLVAGIRPPSVQTFGSRLRISLSRSVMGMEEKLINAFRKVLVA